MTDWYLVHNARTGIAGSTSDGPPFGRGVAVIHKTPDYSLYAGRGGHGQRRAAPPLLMNIYWNGSFIQTTPGGSGSYTLSKVIDIGYVADALVAVSFVGGGLAANGITGAIDYIFAASWRGYLDIFSVTDIFDWAVGQQVVIYPEIQISQNGTTYPNPWQIYRVGVYTGRMFRIRMILISYDPQVIAYLQKVTFGVSVPTRVDHWAMINNIRTSLTSLALSSGGSTLVFLPDVDLTTAPFNSGIASTSRPNISITPVNPQTNDIFTVISASLSQAVIQATNAGTGAARTVNVSIEGY